MPKSKRSVRVLPIVVTVAVISGLWSRGVLALADPAAPKSPDPAAVEALIAASAQDFRTSSPAIPVAIRKARVGFLSDGGEGWYVMCGSFKSDDSKGSEWIQFATIKTSPYEQWIGGMAEAQCANKRIKWYAADHAVELLRRVQSK
jgi:hypothetical protein